MHTITYGEKIKPATKPLEEKDIRAMKTVLRDELGLANL
jgi:hypothetical protein